MSNNTKFDFLFVALGRLTTAIFSLISFRILTTILEPNQYGELTLFISVQAFCGLLLTSPVNQHINLHVHTWLRDGSLCKRLRSYSVITLISSTIGSIGAFFVIGLIGIESGLGKTIFNLTIMFFFIFSGAWNSMLIPLLNIIGYRTASVNISLITALLSFLSSIVLITILSKSVLIWLLGQAIGLFLGALGAVFVFDRTLPQKFNKAASLPILTKKDIIRYCLPLAVINFFIWLHINGYRFIVEYYWGLNQLGLFAVGLLLANQIWTVAESVLIQILHPIFLYRISKKDNKDKEYALSDLINVTIPVLILLMGMTILMSPYIIRIFVSPQFEGAKNFFLLGIFVEFLRVLANTISNFIHIVRNATLLIFPYGVGALIIIFGVLFLGMQGLRIYWVVVLIVLGSFIRLIIITWLALRQIQFNLDFVRFIASVLFLTAMIFIYIFTPVSTEFSSIIYILLFILIFTGVILFLILWKSDALRRIVNVQLIEKVKS